jgi:hypothetical protein
VACHLLSRWFLAQLIFSTPKMEAICSETSVDTQRTTRRCIDLPVYTLTPLSLHIYCICPNVSLSVYPIWFSPPFIHRLTVVSVGFWHSSFASFCLSSSFLCLFLSLCLTYGSFPFLVPFSLSLFSFTMYYFLLFYFVSFINITCTRLILIEVNRFYVN